MICGVGCWCGCPLQLFRVGSGRRTSPMLRHGLKDQGWGGVSSADISYDTDERDKGGS